MSGQNETLREALSNLLGTRGEDEESEGKPGQWIVIVSPEAIKITFISEPISLELNRGATVDIRLTPDATGIEVCILDGYRPIWSDTIKLGEVPKFVPDDMCCGLLGFGVLDLDKEGSKWILVTEKKEK